MTEYVYGSQDEWTYVGNDAPGVVPVEKYGWTVYVTAEFRRGVKDWEKAITRPVLRKARKAGYTPVDEPVIREWPLDPSEPVPAEMESGADRYIVTVLVVKDQS